MTLLTRNNGSSVVVFTFKTLKMSTRIPSAPRTKIMEGLEVEAKPCNNLNTG